MVGSEERWTLGEAIEAGLGRRGPQEPDPALIGLFCVPIAALSIALVIEFTAFCSIKHNVCKFVRARGTRKGQPCPTEKATALRPSPTGVKSGQWHLHWSLTLFWGAATASTTTPLVACPCSVALINSAIIQVQETLAVDPWATVLRKWYAIDSVALVSEAMYLSD